MILSIKSLADSQAVLINQNDKAPYSGVLMSMTYARELEKNSLDAQLYKSELDKNLSTPAEYKLDGGRTVLIGVGCLALGILIGVVAH